jgi:adenylate cyclase
VEESERLPRKLAAILYADVAGYSRLTGEDEDATHRTLRECLDLISAIVARHRGRVIHYAGDAVLAMFEAVVDALTCATAIQEELKARGSELSEDRRLEFRIGVNLGDVIEDRGDIYGDGVNIAARLESLADPGGICISGTVHDAIGDKLAVGYEFMGEQRVKNIDKPVRAYRVLPEATPPTGTATSEPATLQLPDKPSIAAHYRSAHRWNHGRPRVGRAIRSRPRRHLCRAGRGDPGHRRGAGAQADPRRAETRPPS